MPWYEWMYYTSFLVGFVYALVSFLLGHVGGDGLEDAGSGDAGGADVGGDVGGHDVSLSPFSPVVIAMFLATYGGAGVICIKMFEIQNVAIHMPVSLVSGLLGGTLTFMFFFKLFAAVQGSVLPTSRDIVGTEAEVIMTIPGHEKLGEITYIARKSRMNAPARSEDGTQIPAHTTVVISKIVGSTMYVKPVRR